MNETYAYDIYGCF